MNIVDEAKELIPWLEEESLIERMAKEIERLRARVKLLEETLIKAATELEDQGLYEAPLMCRKIVERGKE